MPALSLKERIELLESDLRSRPPKFIMTRSLPFAIFRYDPSLQEENEWKMRQEVQKLAVRVHNSTGRCVELISMAGLFWKSVRGSEDVESLVEFEKEHGFEAAEKQVNRYLSDEAFTPLSEVLVRDTVEKDQEKCIVFLVHASAFAPSAYRLSSLLEQIGGKIKVPCVLFYPGTWDGSLNYMGLRNTEHALGSYRVKIYGRD
jgi:Domain of unknown function (DUF1788)